MSLRPPISLVIAAAVAFGSLPSMPSVAQPISRAEYEACQARDDAGLKTAITQIASDAITEGTKSLDYRALVADQWRERGLSQIIDARVDIAVGEVTTETSWADRLQSLANSEKSQQLATLVAERVYRSDAVKVAIEDLASGVAKEVGKTIEFASTDATRPLLECLKAYVGPRYGGAVANALAGDAGRNISVDPNKGTGEASAGSMLKESGGGLAGATILIVRRQLAGLAARVGQRIVGSVLARLVSVVAGGVGLVLIAKDLWDFRNGVLPIIAEEMKSPATKQKVQDELSASLTQQMNDHVKEIAQTAADQVIEIWQSFRRAHDLVLRMADQNAEFKTFLDGVKPEALPRLDEIVSIVVPTEGEDAVLRRLRDGSLNTAVHLMPPEGVEIAHDLKSVQAGLDWFSLAGDHLPKVIEYELHKRVDPKTLTRASLERILALTDRSAIIKMANLPGEARDMLFTLRADSLDSLLRSLSEDELTALSGYLSGLRPEPRAKVLEAIADKPANMRILASRRVRERIIASGDQSAAIDMMLAPSQSFSVRQTVADFQLVWEGKVAPLLLWDKHPLTVVGAGLGALILLFWIARLFRPRRITAPQTTQS
jgi:hypothetical protein